MPRLVCLIAVAFAGPALADSPPSVADLAKQLGDPKFATREAAQKELLRRGEGVVPELDRLAKTADAEAAERLRKVRYDLVGYKDDIRRLLADVHEGKDSDPVPVSDELRGLIAGHQPGAGDVLLSILTNPKHKLHRPAVRTFVACWDAATPDQVDAYIRQSVTLGARHRPKFPAKVGALIPFEAELRDGWSGWPPIRGGRKFDFHTRTTCYLDGKPYDKPFDHPYPFATVGTYRVGELDEGKHTINAVMEYEFTHRGERREGEIRSSESTFEIGRDMGDDLAASASVSTANLVRASLRTYGVPTYGSGRDAVDIGGYSEPPHVTWEVTPGRSTGVYCPIWAVGTALPLDLCFDVEIHDVESGKSYPANPICVVRGEQVRGYVVPRDVRAFAEGRSGLVRVEVTFKPSRALALSEPRVKQYFPSPISTELYMKIVPPAQPIRRAK